jgi:hypothetical protein
MTMPITIVERLQQDRTPEAARRPPGHLRPPAHLSSQSTAEIAECTCPEACERDHDRD